jgi:hypothetical protein
MVNRNKEAGGRRIRVETAANKETQIATGMIGLTVDTGRQSQSAVRLPYCVRQSPRLVHNLPSKSKAGALPYRFVTSRGIVLVLQGNFSATHRQGVCSAHSERERTIKPLRGDRQDPPGLHHY